MDAAPIDADGNLDYKGKHSLFIEKLGSIIRFYWGANAL